MLDLLAREKFTMVALSLFIIQACYFPPTPLKTVFDIAKNPYGKNH